MFSRYLTILLASCVSFQTFGFQILNTPVRLNDLRTQKIEVPGSTEPLPYFNPLRLGEHISFSKQQESELKHGRIAMLASLGLITQKSFHPFMPEAGSNPLFHFQEFSTIHQQFPLLLVCSLALIELYSIRRGWASWKLPDMADLKDDYIPGDLGLNFIPDDGRLMRARNQELNHGRLAMIACAYEVYNNLS